jgi:hypothetical protein
MPKMLISKEEQQQAATDEEDFAPGLLSNK